jgi:cell division protein FtsL
MRPSLTPAARGTNKKPPDQGTVARSAGHRRALRRQSNPRAPRRVSGPLAGLTRSEAVIDEVQPRRTARTARRARAATPAPRQSPLAGSIAFVRALPDHSLLDRVVRGRAWIPLLGVLLAGIVAMQVEVLKLNAGIGRALEQGTALQSRNEVLRASVASLDDAQRIESLAAQMGMVMPAPQSVRFLSAGAATDQRALAGIQQPDPTSFATLVAADDSATASPVTATGTAAAPGG